MGISAKVIILGNDLDSRLIGTHVKQALDEGTRDYHREHIANSGYHNVIHYNNVNKNKKIKIYSRIVGFDFYDLSIEMTYKLVDRSIQIFAPPNYNDYRKLDDNLNCSISISMGSGVEHTKEIIDVIRRAVVGLGGTGARVFYTYDDSESLVEQK